MYQLLATVLEQHTHTLISSFARFQISIIEERVILKVHDEELVQRVQEIEEELVQRVQDIEV